MSKSVYFEPGAKCLVPPDRHERQKFKEREVRHGGVQDEGESSRVRCGKREHAWREREKGREREREALVQVWV